MGISNTIPPSRLIQPGVVANTAARPTSPFEGQAIYQADTDEVLYYNGTSWSRPWNMPWGQVGYATRSAGGYSFNAAAAADLTGMSITFTAVANRLYKFTWNISGQKGTNAGYIQVFLTNAANTQLASVISSQVANGYYNNSGTALQTFSAGSQTLKMRAETNTNTAYFYADSGFPMTFIAEDIGPV